jgi:hypothetical protein
MKSDARVRFYIILAVCASIAMALMLIFSDALTERALLFVPIFFSGAVYALYKISGEVPPVTRRVKETLCPLTRSQMMFARLFRERRFGSLLQVAYISFFFRIQSVTGIDVTRVWPVSHGPLISRGIDPEFVRRAREEYISLQKGHVTVSADEYGRKVEEIMVCLKMIDGSKDRSMRTGGIPDGRKG